MNPWEGQISSILPIGLEVKVDPNRKAQNYVLFRCFYHTKLMKLKSKTYMTWKKKDRAIIYLKVISVEGQVRSWWSVEQRSNFWPKIDLVQSGTVLPKSGHLLLSPLKSFDNEILYAYGAILKNLSLKKSFNSDGWKGGKKLILCRQVIWCEKRYKLT